MTNIGSSLDSSLRSRAQNLHDNSKQLEKQQKDVIKATDSLRKETDKLKKVADEGARRVKELGNVQNWAEMLERDFLVLQETLRLVDRGSGSDSGSSWETDGSLSGDGEQIEGQKGEEGNLKMDGEHTAAEEGNHLDVDGDTAMDVVEHEDKDEDKGKGRQDEIQQPSANVEQHGEAAGGSSTATTGSSSDPSSGSIPCLCLCNKLM